LPKRQRPVAQAPRLRNRRRESATPGPGRPTAARVEAINRAILVVAGAELVKSGFEATRMDTIAAAAGVSKGTLYGRYPTKALLLRAVLADRVAVWSADLDPENGLSPSDLRLRLKHRARQLMKYNCSDEVEELERLFSGAPAMNELRRMRHEVGHTRIVQVIAQDIIDGTRDRLVEPGTAIRTAEMLVSMLCGWWRMHQEIRRVTSEEGSAYADCAVDVLFDGRSAWGDAR
jgi:TetR/AcrR family transcriptional repressor of mexJK operon